MSEGGRLFGIMACVGGAAMIGSAGLVWKEGFFAKPNGNGYGIILRAGAYGRAMLLMGLIVIGRRSDPHWSRIQTDQDRGRRRGCARGHRRPHPARTERRATFAGQLGPGSMHPIQP
jgi:hypothetical protein